MAEAVSPLIGNVVLSHSAPARPHRNQYAPETSRTPAGVRHGVRFAHPAEANIARLLDTWHIPWEYEPTTFPLVTGMDGSPLQSITPDFYLPRHDVYIEMTTMRQSLVTRKNRKFRLLRERYPDLNVRLLYRRDVELIVERYGRTTAVAPGPGPVLASADVIRRRTSDIVTSLATQFGHQAVTFVALGTGVLPFAAGVHEAWTGETSGPPPHLVCLTWERVTAWIEFSLSATLAPAGLTVLVADVVGTGLTAHAASSWLAAQGHQVHAVVALADRSSARILPVPDLVSVVQAPSHWLSGAGVGGDDAPNLHLCPALDQTD